MSSLCKKENHLGISFPSQSGDMGQTITDGIDITSWNAEVKGRDEPLSFSIWDFAGQTVYYNTHQVRIDHVM